jgi:Tfp pilus assembly protein PilN
MALTLSKKSSAALVVVPPWHPNIRIAENLPDTKVVRTAFFVNGAAMLVAISLALYLGIQEWKLHEVNKQIADWQRQIDRDKKESAEKVALYQDFKAEEAKTNEVSDFIESEPVVSAIILRLGAVTPKKIALDSLEFKGTGFNIRATIKGAPDRASTDVSAYLKQLRIDKVIGPMLDQVNLLTDRRNVNTGRLVIEIFCQYKKGTVKKT